MLRTAAFFVALSLTGLVACAKRRPAPSPAPCMAAMFGVFDDVKAGKAPEPKRLRALACSELYRHAACGDAWKRELELASKPVAAEGIHADAKLPDPASIARACSKAYCSELSSKPALCEKPPPSGNEALVAAIRELDAAILLSELDDRGLAEGLAVRAEVFRIHQVAMELPAFPKTEAADARAILSVDIAADESIALDGRAIGAGDLERELEKVDGLSELRAVIHADRKASHGRVIEVMDALKRAGVTRVAFGVNPPAAPAPSATSTTTKP
jgi:biopolymer transport protein ExbD